MGSSNTFPIRVPLDMTRNQIYNAIMQVLASAPASPVAGLYYFDSALDTPRIYSSTRGAFINLDATKATDIPLTAIAPIAANSFVGNNTASAATPVAMTAAQAKTVLAITPADVSGFDTQVRTSRLDQMAAPTAAVNVNSQNITNVATPVNPTDAANKSYVDAATQSSASGIDPKDAVNAATTANITLSGAQTIDGVSVVAGNRVLVKNQTTASQNGIYVAASGAWSLASDSVQGELTQGAMMLVLAGTVNGGTQWWLQTADPITVGTTALTFVQFGAGGTYTAGNGITLNGNAFAVGAGTGIVTAVGLTSIDTTVVARKYATTIGDGTTTTFTITHGLATTDVIVQVVNLTTGDVENTSVNIPNASTVTVFFTVAPTASQYRVIVHG